MGNWTIADTISGMISTFFGFIGIIISFVTMKKTSSIEKKLKVQKNIRAFNVQYGTLINQINLILEQLSQNDLNSTLLSGALDIISRVKQLAVGGEWDKADIDLINNYYHKLYDNFENYKLIFSDKSDNSRFNLGSNIEKALIDVKNILDKVANYNDIR